MISSIPAPIDQGQALTFVLTVAISWLATWLVKRLGDRSRWSRPIRRSLPLVAPLVGASVQSALSLTAEGYPWWQAALWGAVAGWAAVWSQEVRSATLSRDVGGPPTGGD